MRNVGGLALLVSALAGPGPVPRAESLPLDPNAQAARPDRTVEITRRGGKLAFVEPGKAEAGAVTVVVGQTLRWDNRDDQPHRLVSVAKAEGKPLLDTGPIRPGGNKDLVVNIDMYRGAGGRPANFVRFKYHCADHEGEAGELLVLSAARR